MNKRTLSASFMTFRSHLEILPEQWMASQAVRLSCATGIFCPSHDLQVCGIHAPMNTTQVVDVQTDGYWPGKKFVGNPMCEVGSPSPFITGSPVGIGIASPEPTVAALINLRPELCDKLFIHAEPHFSVSWSRAQQRRGSFILSEIA